MRAHILCGWSGYDRTQGLSVQLPSHELARHFDPSRDFLWASGVEDTFIPQTKRGHRALDEYELIGHYAHWREDLALAREVGVQALRWGIPWYRVEPRPGEFDWSWTDEVLPYLVHDLQIMPIVDLMHYGCPLWLEREFVNEEYPRAVAAYAEAFARRYQDLVSWYTPLNEPLMNALWCGKLGLWPPYLRGDRGYARIMMQLAKGIVRTVEAIKGVDPQARIVHVEAAGLARAGVPELQALAHESQAQIFLSYDLVSGRVDPDHLLFPWLMRHGASLHDLTELRRHAVPLDIVGLNFYPQWSTRELQLDRAGRMRSRLVEKDGAGFAELLAGAHRRYDVPVMVTETSARGTHGVRLRWMNESIAAIKHLREEGVPVVGYTWFPMMTMFEWRYRFGTQPAEKYRTELGLYVLGREPEKQRWQTTPLVDHFRRYVEHSESSIGVLAGSSDVTEAGIPAAS
jgi:beta-glucosidase